MSRILLIDDDESVRKSFRVVLEGAGYSVIEAGNGRDGIKLAEGTFDLIITDLIMPDMDGLEVIRALRKARPGAKILAVSGGGQVNPGVYLGWAEKFGADMALGKPLSRTDLLNAVAELLK